MVTDTLFTPPAVNPLIEASFMPAHCGAFWLQEPVDAVSALPLRISSAAAFAAASVAFFIWWY